MFKWFGVTKDGNSYVLIRIILAKVYRILFKLLILFIVKKIMKSIIKKLKFTDIFTIQK